LKSSLHGISALCFSRQNNYFGSLPNHKAPVIHHLNELLLWQLAQWFVRLKAT
jgi:hypothetical protein